MTIDNGSTRTTTSHRENGEPMEHRDHICEAQQYHWVHSKIVEIFKFRFPWLRTISGIVRWTTTSRHLHFSNWPIGAGEFLLINRWSKFWIIYGFFATCLLSKFWSLILSSKRFREEYKVVSYLEKCLKFGKSSFYRVIFWSRMIQKVGGSFYGISSIVKLP